MSEKPSPAMQEAVDCFALGEQALLDAIVKMARASQCVDTVAREANAAGLDVRAFEQGDIHHKVGAAMMQVNAAFGNFIEAHQLAYERGDGLGLPIPQPEGGGR